MFSFWLFHTFALFQRDLSYLQLTSFPSILSGASITKLSLNWNKLTSFDFNYLSYVKYLFVLLLIVVHQLKLFFRYLQGNQLTQYPVQSVSYLSVLFVSFGLLIHLVYCFFFAYSTGICHGTASLLFLREINCFHSVLISLITMQYQALDLVRLILCFLAHIIIAAVVMNCLFLVSPSSFEFISQTGIWVIIRWQPFPLISTITTTLILCQDTNIIFEYSHFFQRSITQPIYRIPDHPFRLFISLFLVCFSFFLLLKPIYS